MRVAGFMVKKGYRIIFLVTLILGVYFEALIFFYFQTRKISEVLLDDFKIIIAISDKADKDKIIKEIISVKGVNGANFIPKEDILDQLEKEDNELYISIRSMKINPIPDIIEVKVDPLFVGSIDNIVDEISKVKGIFDIRYKPDELLALVHNLFYSRFLSLVIWVSILIVSFSVIIAIIYRGFSNFLNSLLDSFKYFLDGMLGAFVGIVFIYLTIYPIKYLSILWIWPELIWHIVTLIMGGLMGWVLFQWKKS